MSKRGGNHPIPGHFSVQGGQVEDRDAANKSKQALGRQEARKKRRAGRKTALGPAPKEQRAREPIVPSSTVLANVHDREFTKMNERQAAPGARRHDAASDAAEHPRYLSDAVFGMARRVAQVALAPLSLARAVVHRLRKHE
ncbi:MAG: hypothetical protein JWN44_2447 [Myxococcales bacterium]|nr:hypothetical protein [Myxococcales bacterium]